MGTGLFSSNASEGALKYFESFHNDPSHAQSVLERLEFLLGRGSYDQDAELKCILSSMLLDTERYDLGKIRRIVEGSPLTRNADNDWCGMMLEMLMRYHQPEDLSSMESKLDIGNVQMPSMFNDDEKPLADSVKATQTVDQAIQEDTLGTENTDSFQMTPEQTDSDAGIAESQAAATPMSTQRREDAASMREQIASLPAGELGDEGDELITTLFKMFEAAEIRPGRYSNTEIDRFDLATLPDDTTMVICKKFAELEMTHMCSCILIHVGLLPKALALTTSASRVLVKSALIVATRQPQPIVERLLIPMLNENPGPAQCELCNRIVKEGLPQYRGPKSMCKLHVLNILFAS